MLRKQGECLNLLEAGIGILRKQCTAGSVVVDAAPSANGIKIRHIMNIKEYCNIIKKARHIMIPLGRRNQSYMGYR